MVGSPRRRKRQERRPVEASDREWNGSPLDMHEGMDPYGVREFVLEFESGDKDTFRPRLRETFESYELHQMATYLDAIAHSVRLSQRD
jgi:hypothetical protein